MTDTARNADTVAASAGTDRGIDGDWVSRLADEVVVEAKRRGMDTIVCASGISPSGPVHLGNLREVITPHLVADEIKRRGIACEHIMSWDDYDRFRKVPFGVGVDESWNQHIGKPLTSVPPPPGSAHDSWAEHFKAPLVDALTRMGIDFRGISQTQQYTSGAYREQILHAMRERAHIDEVLGRYRTKAADPAAVVAGQAKKLDADQEAAAAEAAEGSGAASEDDGTAATGYYPYKPYCDVCQRDTTTVTAYDDETTALTYTCACGHGRTVLLSESNHGKLVWKVDWPMRWAYEGVVFEPSGVDHQSPGSSFVVGGQLVREIFGGERPVGPMYAFVGIKGMAKMSSSKGGVPTPAEALEIMEPAILRWLYARRKPSQSFDISFGQEIQRLYDEWDALVRKVTGDSAQPGDLAAYQRASSTAAGELARTPHPLPFRTLASVVDITTGHDDQTLRILSELDPDDPLASLDEARPRLTCAENWVDTQVAAEDRTRVRVEPDAELLSGVGESEREELRVLLEGHADPALPRLDDAWSLDGLTTQVYGVPKVLRDIEADAKLRDPELSKAQREFFKLVYRLLIGKETGPRLPTLLLAVGLDRTKALLGH
jgi:lysyl-tRNA synthetase class 1